MGFLKTCLEFITHAAFTPWSTVGGLFDYQRPIFSNPPSTIESDQAPNGGYSYRPTIDPKTCRYPNLYRGGVRSCHTEKKRWCWLQSKGTKRWDDTTDYEDPNEVPTGITREYWLTIDKTPGLSPDGQPKTNGVTINGTYPGPLIEACWGDTIKVHVRNRYQENGTTIHWHGIRQLGSNEMDGVNGVTQCPIAYDEEFTYEFQATQHGHTWYHSHYSLQYPDGVAGPLIIHGPTSDNWDIDLGPIMVSDWVYNTAFDAFNCEAYPDLPACRGGNSPPKADNIVVNGIGSFRKPDGTFTNNYFKTTFKPKKKHLLRLINGSASSSYVFSIDNHTMTVVASDLVAVKPYKTNSLLLGIGQRYTIIVEANQQIGSYWMRTTPAAGCHSFRTNSTTHEFTQVKETTSFIVYDGAPSLPFPDPSISRKQKGLTNACVDESQVSKDRLVPKVPWKVLPAENVVTPFTAALESKTNPYLYPQLPFAHWVLASDALTNPLWVNFSHPTILDPYIDTPFSQIVRFHDDYGFVYLIIDSKFLKPNPDFIEISTAHPIHLHGSDFVVLAQSSSPWDPNTSPRTFKLDNPARRDTAMLPAGGFLALAFKPDNPGAWLMHCHIAWHASSGLALQIVVRPKDIPEFNGDLLRIVEGCKTWQAWDQKEPVVQTDSGI